jgi:hypothetical protein
MGTILRRLLRWLDGLILPPFPEGGEAGGVADRELDGPGSGTSATSATRFPNRRAASGFDRKRTWFKKGPGPSFVTRPAPIPSDYQVWKELALLLYSGRAPEGLEVENPLSLAKLRIRSLPARLSVRGDLDLRQCQRLNRIGDGLLVSGDLLVGGKFTGSRRWDTYLIEEPWPSVLHTLSTDGQCPLPELPAALRVGRDLRLRQCRRLRRLPDDLQVGCSIYLESCTALDALPEPFIVGGDLTISAAPNLSSLPAWLRVEGSLRLIGLRLDRLPDDLRVGGDLILECCPRLGALPQGLSVGGSLLVRRCPIVQLPSDLRVGRDLKLHRLRDLDGLPEGLAVPGRLEVIRCPSLWAIPPGLRVGTDLIIRRCEGLRELPQGLHVPGTLDLRGCVGLKSLPAGLSVGSKLGAESFRPALRLADCEALRTLPEDLEVDGPIEVAGSGLRDLPDRLDRSVRLLWRGVVVPPEVVFRPGTLTPERILGERNAELRRVMLERAGLEDVLRRADARIMDSDQDPGGARRLVRLALPARFGRARNRFYLHCRCPSTGRDYLLRVPPETQTCREAAAWLAGFDDPEAYRPVQET